MPLRVRFKAPKVFHRIGVNLTIDLLLSMVNNAMNEFITELVVRAKRVGVDVRSAFRVLYNLRREGAVAYLFPRVQRQARTEDSRSRHQ